MQDQDEKYKYLLQAISRLTKLVIGLSILVLILLYFVVRDFKFTPSKTVVKDSVPAANTVVVKTDSGFWKAPDVASLSNEKDKELILYGKELIHNTRNYFGADGSIIKNNTNALNCTSCHMEDGTRVFGINYGSVYSTYPKYRARSGTIENVYKRVNDCFERSLNGNALDTTSREMQAIVSYINWIGKEVKKGEQAKGSGIKMLEFLERKADKTKGELAYAEKCSSCHGRDGAGIGQYPPLWGDKSYNDGAGMYRIRSLSGFIKYNMPFGVNYQNPQLTDEEAWDIAAFVNSQPHPHKDTKKDWPKLNEKPVDHPFGPYADGFNEIDHKYGPFKAIKQKLESLKKGKP